jgi:23S rRNA (uridine2552-2'-O)-methyltransferase
MSKNKFSKQWVHDHINDPYVKLATKHGYRARAAFKLIEIDEQDRLIRKGMRIVDLGSTPGSWCQVLRERLAIPQGGLDGQVIALDLLPMEPVADIEFILGDFREDSVAKELEQRLGGHKLDLVLSDMAPNLSGVASVDSAQMEYLAELAVDFSKVHLKPNGALLIKCFHGASYNTVVKLFRATFSQVLIRKPNASRAKSKETFLLGRGMKSDHS